jgi:hypothetical protein
MANQALIEDAGIKLTDLETFIQSPDASLVIGRMLYPRYYKMNQGAISFLFHPYVTMDFPRTAFNMIGPTGDHSIILPGDLPEHFPHASDALVLGCNGPDYLDAVLVIVLDENKTLYQRNPAAELRCPLPRPVCNNNSACQ